MLLEPLIKYNAIVPDDYCYCSHVLTSEPLVRLAVKPELNGMVSARLDTLIAYSPIFEASFEDRIRSTMDLFLVTTTGIDKEMAHATPYNQIYLRDIVPMDDCEKTGRFTRSISTAYNFSPIDFAQPYKQIAPRVTEWVLYHRPDVPVVDYTITAAQCTAATTAAAPALQAAGQIVQLLTVYLKARVKNNLF